MKVLSLKQILSRMSDDLEVVIHSGGDDGFGYSPVIAVDVCKASFGVGIDGPFRLDNKGDKEVVALS